MTRTFSRIRRSLLCCILLAAAACDDPVGTDGAPRIVVTPETLTLYPGGVVDLAAVAVDEEGDPVEPQPAITWSSGSTGVAVVANPNGRVTAVGLGTTTVRASGGGMIGEATITVVQKPVASVTVSLLLAEIPLNTPTPIEAIPQAADGEVLTGRTCTWTVVDPDILTVTQTGNDRATLTGKKAGTTFVRATCEGKTGSGIITVRDVVVSSISISPDPASVEIDRTLQLTATVRDASNNVITRPVTWSSSATSIATVDPATGLVTGKAEGTAEISATSGTVTARRTVTVRPKPIASVTVTPVLDTIYVGQEANFYATARAADGEVITRGFFSWTVSNPTALTQNMIQYPPQYARAQVFGARGDLTTTLTASLEGVTGSGTLVVLEPRRLTLTTSGTGGGTLNPDPSRETYTHNTVVRVTPTPDAYSYFSSWGGACSGTTIPCQVTMSTHRTVNGTFTVQPFTGPWTASVSALRSYSDGGSCRWAVSFSNGSVLITYPRNSSGVRTVSVVVRTTISSPAGQGTGNHNCNQTPATPFEQTLTGTPGTDGSFSLTGRLASFDVTVTGSMSPGRTVPGTVSLRYNPSSDVGSGTGSGSFTAQPTPPPGP